MSHLQQPGPAQESNIPTKLRPTATRQSQKSSCSQAMPQTKRRRKADDMMISIHSDGSTEAPSDAISSDEDDSPVSTPDKRQKVLKVVSLEPISVSLAHSDPGILKFD